MTKNCRTKLLTQYSSNLAVLLGNQVDYNAVEMPVFMRVCRSVSVSVQMRIVRDGLLTVKL